MKYAMVERPMSGGISGLQESRTATPLAPCPVLSMPKPVPTRHPVQVGPSFPHNPLGKSQVTSALHNPRWPACGPREGVGPLDSVRFGSVRSAELKSNWSSCRNGATSLSFTNKPAEKPTAQVRCWRLGNALNNGMEELNRAERTGLGTRMDHHERHSRVMALRGQEIKHCLAV